MHVYVTLAPLECLLKLLAIDPQTLQGIAFVFDYLSELDGKILLLKTPYIGATEHGKIKLVLTSKLHPYWLASVVLEGAVLDDQRRKVMALFKGDA